MHISSFVCVLALRSCVQSLCPLRDRNGWCQPVEAMHLHRRFTEPAPQAIGLRALRHHRGFMLRSSFQFHVWVSRFLPMRCA